VAEKEEKKSAKKWRDVNGQNEQREPH
jgi:hypothetical protein